MATLVVGHECDNRVGIIPVSEIITNERRGIYQLNWYHSLESVSITDDTLPWKTGMTLIKFFGGVTADFSNITMSLIYDERFRGDKQEISSVHNGFHYWLSPGIIAVITNVARDGEISLMISRTGNDFGEQIADQ